MCSSSLPALRAPPAARPRSSFSNRGGGGAPSGAPRVDGGGSCGSPGRALVAGAALKNVDRAYFVYPIRPGLVQATAQFAQAAQEAGIEAIVNMSQVSARNDAKSHAARDHWLAEQVLDWSGLNVTHIRPTYFAEWLLYLAPMIRQGVMYAPFTT